MKSPFWSFVASFILQTTLLAQVTECVNSNANGADASLGYHDNYNTENNNYGGDLYLKAFCVPGASGGLNTNRGVMYFYTGFISPSAQVINATLTLHASGYVNSLLPGHFGNNASGIYRITQSWQESTVTWNNQPMFTTNDFSNLPMSSTSTQDYVVDVTPIATFHVQNPQQNYGYLLRLYQENPNDPAALSFFSSDAASVNEWPELCITYLTNNDTLDTVVNVTPVVPPIELPNVLTINSDNINDVYTLPQGVFQSFTVAITNRWGQEVYTNHGENGWLFWDGKSGSDYCEEGVYFYSFDAILNDGQIFKKNGFIQLFD